MNSLENEETITQFIEGMGEDGWTYDDQGIVKAGILISGYDGQSELYINAGGWSQQLTRKEHLLFFLCAYVRAVSEKSE